MEQKPSRKKIEEVLIAVGIEVAKKGEGALFVVSSSCPYKKLLKQKIEPFSLFEEGARKTLLSIAMVDGAVIINRQGMVIDYGVLIKTKKVFHGFGTRHSAAFSASFYPETTAVLVSEEEKKIKIFNNGRLIMQVDALEKGIEKDTEKIATMLETIGAGFIGTVGAAAFAPTLGIALIPGVLIFGGSYYAIKNILQKFHRA